MSLPKPRIFMHRGVWICCLLDWQKTRVRGDGYRPELAYEDWRAQYRYWLNGGWR